MTAAGVNISIDIRKELSKIENIIAQNLTEQEAANLIILLTKVKKSFSEWYGWFQNLGLEMMIILCY